MQKVLTKQCQHFLQKNCVYPQCKNSHCAYWYSRFARTPGNLVYIGRLLEEPVGVRRMYYNSSGRTACSKAISLVHFPIASFTNPINSKYLSLRPVFFM